MCFINEYLFMIELKWPETKLLLRQHKKYFFDSFRLKVSVTSKLMNKDLKMKIFYRMRVNSLGPRGKISGKFRVF